jgi:uncharacterized protein (DUF924 family)
LRTAVLAGGRKGWITGPRGRLAAVIVLDQFSRNMYRDTPDMYSGDALALRWAQDGIEQGQAKDLGYDERAFLYMPLMHAEQFDCQDRCVELFEAEAERAVGARVRKRTGQSRDYARLHRDIVARFGRFPHRNDILGRASTPEEIEFLTTPGSSF